MDEVLNPVEVEARIREISNRIARSVQVCSDRYRDFMRADLEYDHAFAVAYMAHEGPAHEKKYGAEIATKDQREARDIADTAYRHADRLPQAPEAELRGRQAAKASLRNTYAVSGVGER